MKIVTKQIGATAGAALTKIGEVVEIDDHRGQLFISVGAAELAPEGAVADRTIGGDLPPRSLRRMEPTPTPTPAPEPTAGETAEKK
jgi:hypothetical protein